MKSECITKKTRVYMKNLGHSSLHLGTVNNWLKFYRYSFRVNGNIHIQRIIVKRNAKNMIFMKIRIGIHVLIHIKE